MTETTSLAPNPSGVAAAQVDRRRTLKLEHLKGAFARYKILALVVAIAILWGLFTQATGGDFLTARNLSNLLRQMAITGMLQAAPLATVRRLTPAVLPPAGAETAC